MDDLTTELLDIKREWKEATRRKNEAQGAFDQCMSQIKKEYDCETLEKAEEKAKELQEKEQKLRRNLKKKLEEYHKDFGEWIEDEEDQETEMDF